jgi:hypothetical protein
MDQLTEYFNFAKTYNRKLYLILEDLITRYHLIIVKDHIQNDMRTIILKKYLFELTIKNTIIINDNYDKKEYIEILLYNRKFIIINDY